MDIDLFVYKDGGDNVFGCEQGGDTLVAKSTTPTSDEFISIDEPSDGRYWVTVHGWLVPGDAQPFSITIRAVQGNDLIVKNPPSGTLPAGKPVTFEVEWKAPGGGDWEGLLIIGTQIAPNLFTVPVKITNETPPLKSWMVY